MSLPTPLVFVHGWGFDAGLWDAMRGHFKGPVLAVDLGFRGEPAQLASMPKEPCIAVGHSLGFLWLLQKHPVPWKKLVAINGFSRFARADDFPSGIDGRMLKRMIDQCRNDPAAVLADFLQTCGRDERPEASDGETLLEGLTWLRDWDGRKALAHDPAPVMALAGRDDPIVPQALSEASFAARDGTIMHWHDGGHLLPLTAPAWCAEKIREFAEAS